MSVTPAWRAALTIACPSGTEKHIGFSTRTCIPACAERYGIPAVFTDWRDLLGHPLDAVMVLTSGSHAPIAEAAARAGRHVFVEKPMCFSADEGRAMVAAAERAGVKLMVGYPKRYDPAFARMREETARLTGARLLRSAITAAREAG